MKFLLSISLILFSLSLVAQNPLNPNFPFPYNPDGNADGYIGLNDMLDLLAVYGQQYPESFYGDSTGAVLMLGEKTPGGCLRAAKLAGPKWRVLTTTDFYNWDIVLANHFAEQWDQNSDTPFYCHVADKDGDFNPGQIYLGPNQQFWLNSGVGGEGYHNGVYVSSSWVYPSNFSGNTTLFPKQCILVTEVYPQIEYHVVEGSLNSIQTAISDSLSSGWNLAGGLSKGFSISSYYQPIWKYAE